PSRFSPLAPAAPALYPLSLHAALPISPAGLPYSPSRRRSGAIFTRGRAAGSHRPGSLRAVPQATPPHHRFPAPVSALTIPETCRASQEWRRAHIDWKRREGRPVEGKLVLLVLVAAGLLGRNDLVATAAAALLIFATLGPASVLDFLEEYTLSLGILLLLISLLLP